MKKLCLPYRHLFFIFLAFISLSFSFTSKVEASTFTINYNDFSKVSEPGFTTIITNADNLNCPYVILLLNNSYYIECVYQNTLSSFDINVLYGYHIRLAIPYPVREYSVNSDFSISLNGSSGAFSVDLNHDNEPTNYYLLYSSIPIVNISSDTLVISGNNNSITCEANSNCNYLPMYSFYYDYVPPVPPTPDNTPLLTSFYEITIDRLSYLCDYIVNSYIYLAIFSIFILYFVILLIRRLR